jgi:chromosome segregation ATPase
MNAKNTEREREIEKLKIILKEYEENKGKSDARISKLQEELSQRNNQYQELNESYREIKKKLQYL